MEVMSISEYCAIAGVTVQMVYNHIYRNTLPPGVLSHKKSGTTILLYVEKSAIPKKRSIVAKISVKKRK